jgi:hypothetical protein
VMARQFKAEIILMHVIGPLTYHVTDTLNIVSTAAPWRPSRDPSWRIAVSNCSKRACG